MINNKEFLIWQMFLIAIVLYFITYIIKNTCIMWLSYFTMYIWVTFINWQIHFAEINLNWAEVSVYFVIYIYPVTVIKCRRILCTWINKRGLFELLSLCSRPINAAISTLCHTIPFRPVVYGKVRTSCSSIEHLPST